MLHDQLITFLCLACVLFGFSSKFPTKSCDYASLQKKIDIELSNKEERIMDNPYTIFVNGKKITASGYVAVDNGEKFALIPFIPVMERLGIQSEWLTSSMVSLIINGEVYLFDTINFTFTSKGSNSNLLIPAPGAQHKKTIEIKDDIILVDNDTLDLIFYYIIGARIRINYGSSFIFIDHFRKQ